MPLNIDLSYGAVANQRRDMLKQVWNLSEDHCAFIKKIQDIYPENSRTFIRCNIVKDIVAGYSMEKILAKYQYREDSIYQILGRMCFRGLEYALIDKPHGGSQKRAVKESRKKVLELKSIKEKTVRGLFKKCS